MLPRRRREVDLVQLQIETEEVGALPEQLRSGDDDKFCVVRLAGHRQRNIRADAGRLAGGDRYTRDHAEQPI